MSNAWFDAPAPLLPEILALNARWGGRKPAVIFDDDQGRTHRMGWNDFHRQVCQVANGLRADGIEQGDRVAVLMSNHPRMLVTLFGIITAGAVAVPLNPMVSDEGILGMLRDARARAAFVSAELAHRLAGQRQQLPDLRPGACYCAGDAPARPEDGWIDFLRWRERQTDSDPQVPLRDEDECNIIYSSGTTGEPKGIVHTHRRRLDWFYDLAIALRVHRASVNLCTIGLFSNISWAAMGCALLTGSTLVIAHKFDAAAWLEQVEAHRVTHSAMVPVQFQRILEEPAYATAQLGSIESLMVCGSPLGVDLKRQIMARLAPRLVELYGLTEGLVTTLEPEEAADRLSSVGKPLMGTDLRILNDQDQPCAPGEAGEIVGRGRILMAGYHGRDEASAAASWTDEQGRRWLRTGDIGKLDEAGYLYLVDRKKDLIISGGLNIYPADLEQVLLQHPAVSEVAVIAIDSERWGETPLGLYVGERVDSDELLAWANERLGKHQRLAGVVPLPELPRNANGKILKRALRNDWRDWLRRS